MGLGGAACFLVGIVGFSVMGFRAPEKGRVHSASKIIVFGPLRTKAREKVKVGDAMQRSDDRVERYLGTMHTDEGRWFTPMVLFLAEQGVGFFSQPHGYAVYTVTDVTVKVIYGSVLLAGILSIERRAAPRKG